MVFWQSPRQSFIYDSMSAVCLAIVVRRNLDDKEAETLFEKAEPEQEKLLAFVHMKNPPVIGPEEIPVREERILLS